MCEETDSADSWPRGVGGKQGVIRKEQSCLVSSRDPVSSRRRKLLDAAVQRKTDKA